MSRDDRLIQRRGEQVLGTFCLVLGLLLGIVMRWIGGAALVASMVLSSLLLLAVRSWQLWKATE